MSSKTDLLSNEEIRRRGIEALEHALGPVDTIRLQSFSLSRGDYSMERAKVLNLERDEIVKGIEKRRELKKT